ncbi:putative cytochrome P450 oxidoreductase [Talaromyces proteolyticus]|uniref:Cytochrome P450 oxidoreductase n=1 Tax=Talaromyces proteolyticus TaxID=1131652 RepID=A0AAD4KMZ5_9EURO|nr:putative cytochrome P450 oxidoreductase [Talaromyces proteolyticus]KAH8695302.1 putative cytochrome P450 oxidoreductase [Talaromyces proteolyticus]
MPLGIIAVTLLFLISNLGRNKLDPREPLEVKASIPIIGHLLGMINNGLVYYDILSKKYPNLPAFTTSIFNFRTYTIASPSLIQAVQRNARLISFEPFLNVAAERMAGCSKHALEILREKRSGGQGGNQAVIHAMHSALFGQEQDKMIRSMIKGVEVWNDGLAHKAPIQIDMFEWCREAITVASSDAMWGPLNPFKSKYFRDAFWDFEAGIDRLILNFLPHIVARKAWKSRESGTKAFMKYYNANGPAQGSLLAQARWNTMHDMGISVEDVSRLEMGMAVGLLSNTIPATFWVLFDLYSRPELLEQIREEVNQNALQIADKSATIDLTCLRDQCPRLLAFFHESLRLRSLAAPTRFVYEDVVLDNKYLIKAGSMLNISTTAVYRNADSWGPGSSEFDATRFYASSSRKIGGFLGFGISPNLCPGRESATSMILSFVSAFILRFDLEPPSSSSGPLWAEPKLRFHSLSSPWFQPAEPFLVKVMRRKEYQDYEWHYRVPEDKGQFKLSVG